MFEVDRIYCSNITGQGVRSFVDLVFDVERILHYGKAKARSFLFLSDPELRLLERLEDCLHVVRPDADARILYPDQDTGRILLTGNTDLPFFREFDAVADKIDEDLS